MCLLHILIRVVRLFESLKTQSGIYDHDHHGVGLTRRVSEGLGVACSATTSDGSGFGHEVARMGGAGQAERH